MDSHAIDTQCMSQSCTIDIEVQEGVDSGKTEKTESCEPQSVLGNAGEHNSGDELTNSKQERICHSEESDQDKQVESSDSKRITRNNSMSRPGLPRAGDQGHTSNIVHSYCDECHGETSEVVKRAALLMKDHLARRQLLQLQFLENIDNVQPHVDSVAAFMAEQQDFVSRFIMSLETLHDRLCEAAAITRFSKQTSTTQELYPTHGGSVEENGEDY